MSKKFNNLILVSILMIVAGIYGLVKLYQYKYTDNTLVVNLVDIDTSKVTKLLLYPASEGKNEIKFFKDGKDWKVSKGKITADPEANAVQSLLAMLVETKTQRLASRDKSKWGEYLLTDQTASRVKVFEGNKVSLDMLIGKFDVQKSDDPYSKMYGGGSTGTTYVRLTGENEVYAIDGFMSFSLNRPFNTFRNQILARFDKTSVNKISFRYPGDSSFMLMLVAKQWMIGSQKADSAKVAEYLNSLTYKNASSFDDNYMPSLNPQYQVTIEGKDIKTVTIDAYIRGNNDLILNSNQNPKSWFFSPYKGLFLEIFKNKSVFFVNKKKK
jgi:hypothetical protein